VPQGSTPGILPLKQPSHRLSCLAKNPLHLSSLTHCHHTLGPHSLAHSLTHALVAGAAFAEGNPEKFTFKDGKYVLKKLCLEPMLVTVKAESPFKEGCEGVELGALCCGCGYISTFSCNLTWIDASSIVG
jgi:hypothetical protein